MARTKSSMVTALLSCRAKYRSMPRRNACAADDGGHHADHLGALVVHRRGVEIVDRHVAGRLHGMRQRAGILAELRRPQRPDIADPLHRPAALIGGEFLVAIDGETFLQRQLEPVAAGDPVAGPVVEIFVRDDGLDALVVGIGRGLRSGQTYLVLKTFSPLFSIAPMLKSDTAAMLNTSRSYSRPNTSSSHFIEVFSDRMAWSQRSSSPRRT